MPSPPTPSDPHPRSHRLSAPAAEVLASIKTELLCWPPWMHSCSTSVMIELLVWHFRQVRRERKTEVKLLSFRPVTRKGRRQDLRIDDHARPSKMRKAAGLTKLEASLGRKPGGG